MISLIRHMFANGADAVGAARPLFGAHLQYPALGIVGLSGISLQGGGAVNPVERPEPKAAPVQSVAHQAKRPVRVLQIIDTLSMGGAETWLIELLQHWFASRAIRMDFLLTSGNRGLFDDEARRLGARLYYLKYAVSDLPRFAAGFRKILREGEYDAIHDHQDYASGWHFLIGLGVLPRTRVTHVHNPWMHIEDNYAVNPRRKLIASAGKQLVKLLATHVCGTSGHVLEKYGFEDGHGRGPNVSVLHCGFSVGRFKIRAGNERQSVRQEFGWPSDAKIVLFVGRLDEALEFNNQHNHKNSWLALNIARAAAASQPNVRLLMAGAGNSPRQMMERDIEQWGVSDRLKLIGVRHDVDRLMAAADVLLFPSRQEGLGMVAVEAQASGLPVLASDAVPRECIVVPELYRAMPLTDSIDRWASALLEVIAKQRPPLERCATAVEQSAYSIDTSARRLEHIYSAGLP